VPSIIFLPPLARAILQNAVDNGAPIGIFELARRDLAAFLEVTIGGPIGLAFMTPMIQPRHGAL